MKTLVKLLFVLVLTLVGLVLALPLWIGSVGKLAIVQLAPRYAQTRVELGELACNPYLGELRLGDLRLDQVPKAPLKTAVKLGRLSVSVEPATLLSETVHVREILVSDLTVSSVGNALPSLERLAAAAMPSASRATPAATPAPAPAEAKATKSGRKVIIDRFRVENLLVQMGPLAVPLPAFELRDIGRKTGGVDWEAAWEEIRVRTLQASGSLGSEVQKLGDLKNVQNTIDSLKDSSQKLKDFGKELKGLFR